MSKGEIVERVVRYVVSEIVDDAEQDLGWTLGWFGDTATQGIWVQEDPVGTKVGAQPGQPEDDHNRHQGCQLNHTGNHCQRNHRDQKHG